MKRLLLAISLLAPFLALAQGPPRPPAFIGGPPGLIQMQAISTQRHQARTALYREALEILRRNPAAADLPDCNGSGGNACLTAGSGTAAADNPQPKRLALLIGNNRYGAPIPSLSTPMADVDGIAATLRNRFGYETRVLHNAGKAEIIAAINRVAESAAGNDSVLLVYAGHGYQMDDTQAGFWIPVDASVKTPDNWIANADIAKLLKRIPSRQILLISDSCFSGTLTREQKVREEAALSPEHILSQRSVVVLSSGDEEPVSDEGKEGHSIFAYSLMRTLEASQGMTPGFRLYRQVYDRVSRDYAQKPQYGAVLSAGHSAGGEYLLAPLAR